MWKLKSNIQIGNYEFRNVVNVKINRSSRLLTDRATVELPLSGVLQNKQRLTFGKSIKRGDKVSINLGYNDKLNNELTGYVKEVSTNNHKTQIECEDASFLLRKNIDNKLFKNAKLIDIVKYIAGVGGLKLNASIPDVNLDSFIIKDVSALKALQKLKEAYGFEVFIDYNNNLYIGLAYVYSTGKVAYDLQNDIVKDNLTFKKAEDISYKIKAISLLRDNKRLEIEAGDANGEQRTFYFYGINDKLKLKKLAESEVQKYKYTGYRGTLTSFGLPVAKYGMTARIADNNYPERSGDYYIESVNINFGTNGFRRTVELGIKL